MVYRKSLRDRRPSGRIIEMGIMRLRDIMAVAVDGAKSVAHAALVNNARIWKVRAIEDVVVYDA